MHVRRLARRWPYTANTSPGALPEHPIRSPPEEVILLDRFAGEVSEDEHQGDMFHAYVQRFGTEDHTLEQLLASADAAPIEQRRPVLLQGELANPYRLRDINMGPLPVLTVRLEGICRTWADGLDPRDTYPGVHHVTWPVLRVGGSALTLVWPPKTNSNGFETGWITGFARHGVRSNSLRVAFVSSTMQD